MRYVGKLKSNGKVFDQTKGNATFSFRLGVGEVIKGELAWAVAPWAPLPQRNACSHARGRRSCCCGAAGCSPGGR